MACCKIHAVRATVSGAVNYISDPSKTDDERWISSYGCTPESAAEEFKFMLSKTRQADPNKAFHLIQSFAPGEVSPELAHRIGKELADELLAGKYAYVLTTHTDHPHIHNHIVFCAAGIKEKRKYHDCRDSYRRIRDISDRLCLENGLSVIKERGKKGRSYKEWKEEKDGSSCNRREYYSTVLLT